MEHTQPKFPSTMNRLTSLPQDLFMALVNVHLGVTECGSLRSTCMGLRRYVDGVATSLTINHEDSYDGGTDWCYLQSLLGHMASLTNVSVHFKTSITTSALQAFVLAAGQSLRNRLLELYFGPYSDSEVTATSTPLKLSMLVVFPHLTTLDVPYNSGPITLTGLGSLSALQHLSLGDTLGNNRVAISDLSPIANCTSLQNLSIWQCSELDDISPLTSCPGLQHLDLYYCDNLHSITALANCTQLSHLELHRCEGVKDISELSACTLLNFLDLESLKDLEDISPLGSCSLINHLDLQGCVGITDISTLRLLSLLSYLDLSGMNVVDITPLAECKELHDLRLIFCSKVTDITALGACTKLRKVDLTHCPALHQASQILGPGCSLERW
jgi:Leucine-rich repeat (LRR) protein